MRLNFIWGWMWKTSKLLKAHLKIAVQSQETISELITDLYSWAQKKNESEDIFADDLQVLV